MKLLLLDRRGRGLLVLGPPNELVRKGGLYFLSRKNLSHPGNLRYGVRDLYGRNCHDQIE